MGKIIFWIIVVLVALVIARIAARISVRNAQQGAAKQAQAPRGRPAAAGRAVPAEQMVRCAHCGIHLPRSDAALIGGRTWCSQEHARLGERH